MRLVIGAVGAVLLAIGLVLLVSGGPVAWSGIQLVIVGALGVAIALFERLRYGAGGGGPHPPALRPTDERFIDPTSGERTRVWIDPASGERSYLPDRDQSQK
jgi:hypothetical protein